MNLKKNGKLFTSKSVGTGPSSYEKRIYRATVSQRLRNTGLTNSNSKKKKGKYSEGCNMCYWPGVEETSGVGLRPLAYWDRRFECRRWLRCLSVVSVECCQVQFSAPGWSFAQRSPADWCVVLCDIENSRMRRQWSALGSIATGVRGEN